MRRKYLLIGTLMVLVFLLAACGNQATPAPNVAEPLNTVAASTAVQTEAAAVSTEAQTVATAASTAVQGVTVEDFNSLIGALQASGVTVESGEAISQPFFSVMGQILKINGQDVQVFVYDTAEAMETEAAQVAADGSSIGGSMPAWVDVPHFYKAGRMLVLYVGQDQKIIDILSGIFGPQFAGQ